MNNNINSNDQLTNNIDKTVNWSQLFEISNISDYTPVRDRIALSMACKYYRHRLNPIIFSKLKLLKNGIILPFNRKSRATYKHKLEILIKRLKLDLKKVAHLVRVLELCDGFDSQFPAELINLFPNIIVFKVFSVYYRYDLVNLVDLLGNLKNLKGIELSAGYYNYPLSENTKIMQFFKTLNSLRFLRNGHSLPNTSPFLQIDQSFSKLNTLTIYDDRVLANLQLCIPNLKWVELPNYKINEHLLLNFLQFNPQITQMYCKWHRVDFIARILGVQPRKSRSLTEFKDQEYYQFFINFINLYKINYIIFEYFEVSKPVLNVLKINREAKGEIVISGEYTQKGKQINWKRLAKLDNVMVMRYVYQNFYEIDNYYPIRLDYSRVDTKFNIN
ncbi:hypothetical protein CONCODRAFT_7439 [Conidiobolus coronatus NRRL 28638]|uniref:Uncharacterized protein n=1 Tax=Conidiobolus coronatus (strain ATCC 28846 / CBS 209.66 / NRRL 28638) TaxID=796925 RepID=A0A137P4W5_CONC2|nr:hypothetical protein CONCODRAFT_7439 [Conidiobolus coronatus NRRL 28638]|eukprot:KXN70046.1 hypothetical protein CONCODRAFT_7439 [Conidiobolus coronatus NRRL 28638]